MIAFYSFWMLLTSLFLAANPDVLIGWCDFVLRFILPALQTDYLLAPLTTLVDTNTKLVHNGFTYLNPMRYIKRTANDKKE